MGKRCGLRSVRIVKKIKNMIIRALDDDDYLSDIVHATKGMHGGGE